LSKKRCVIQTFFSTTTYAAIPYFGTLLWKAVQNFGKQIHANDFELDNYFVYVLTKTGQQVRDPVLKVVDRVLTEVFAGIAEDDISQTKNLLRRVLANAYEGNR